MPENTKNVLRFLIKKKKNNHEPSWKSKCIVPVHTVRRIVRDAK